MGRQLAGAGAILRRGEGEKEECNVQQACEKKWEW